MNHVFGELVGNGPKIGGLVSRKNSLTQFILQPLGSQRIFRSFSNFWLKAV